MYLNELCKELDVFFNVQAFVEDDWSRFMPEAYRGAAQRFLRPGFADGGWNGLMFEHPGEQGQVDRVYLVVFPGQAIIDKVIAKEVERGAPGALVFTHHPLDYSEKSAEFLPIGIEQIEECKAHHISFYNCHSPLDCHPEISTANALAGALGLEEQTRFARYYAGQAGIHGTVSPTSFQDLAAKLAEVCELPGLRYDQCRNNGQPVQHVAIVPGGGGDPSHIDEAKTLSVDTYVTGHWWLFGSSEYARQDRETMGAYVSGLSMNLLGASHYSSEFIVMRDQMPGWFKQRGVEALVMRQQDPWH
jgi:putative NIF3 family GTP cyclohydrolase 1 type 2